MMKQLRKSMRLLGAVMGALLLLVAGTYSSASAQPLTFTWLPAGATPVLPGGPIGPANNFNVNDFASVTLTGGGGSPGSATTAPFVIVRRRLSRRTSIVRCCCR